HVGVRSTGHPEGREALPPRPSGPRSRIPMVLPGIPAAGRDIEPCQRTPCGVILRPRVPGTPPPGFPQLRSVMIHGLPQTIVTPGDIAPGHANHATAIAKPLVTPPCPRDGPALTMTISSCAGLSVALRLM